jgi:hypothetical protein
MGAVIHTAAKSPGRCFSSELRISSGALRITGELRPGEPPFLHASTRRPCVIL